MRTILGTLVAVAGLLLWAGPAVGQTAGKIAYIDSRKLLPEAPGAREAQQSFEKDMERFKAELKPLEDTLKSMMDDYEQKQVTLSPEAKRQRQEAIRQKQLAYQQRADELEQRAAKRQQELFEPIMKRINQAIEEFRKERGYVLILDAASGALVAADTALDVTDEVLARLKATASASPAASTAKKP